MRSITHRLDRCHAGRNARDIGGSLSSNTDTSGPISGTCTVNVVLGVSAVAVSILDGPAMWVLILMILALALRRQASQHWRISPSRVVDHGHALPQGTAL